MVLQTQVTAIILAGGQSSRMGQDKALLKYRNSTLLAHTCEVAKECASQVYVVTPWLEKYQDILPSSCSLIPELPVTEGKGNNSPLVAFAQGLAQIETATATEWILLLACDLPYLSASQIRQWLTSLVAVDIQAIAYLPRHAKGWEPLCGFYHQSCLPSLQKYIEQGERSFQGWLAQQSVQELAVSDSKVLFNCNTPQDWELVIHP